MARRELTRIQELLPPVFAALARASGNARHLQPAWERIVGSIISRHAWPAALQDDILIIDVESPGWARELAAREPEIRARAIEALGPKAVSKLVFRSRE